MKILEVNKFNFPQGGADRHFLDLVKLLRSHDNEVAVFAMDHLENEPSSWDKYFVSHVGYGNGDSIRKKLKGVLRMFYSLEAKRKIRKLIKNFKPDIVHIHNIYHQISPSILGEIKKKNIPVVATVHDYHLICPDYLLQCGGHEWKEIRDKGWLYFIRKRCFKGSYLKSLLAVIVFSFHKKINIYDKNIDLYVSPSEFAKNILVENGLSKDKISVLPHFYVKDETKGNGLELPREKYVLYAGRISRDKGVEKLLSLFENMNGVSLYLAGRKEEEFKLENSDKVKYLGVLNREELNACMKNSLFIISPSKLPETFGLVALEALSNGKPFIGYDSGAYKEIIEDGQTGYICKDDLEMREKIKKLSFDDGLRILLSRNAMEKSKDFGSELYYQKIIEVFSETIKNKKQNALDFPMF